MAAVPQEFRRSPQTLAGVAKSLLLYLVELAVFLTLFVGYFMLRGLPPDRVALSTANAVDIIDFERRLGVFWEAAWQRAAIDHNLLMDAANFTYLNLHLPLLAVLGFGFFHNSVRKYRVLRNALLLSALIGVPFYILYPVTPPRLLLQAGVDYGFRDTLEGMRGSKPGRSPGNPGRSLIPPLPLGLGPLGFASPAPRRMRVMNSRYCRSASPSRISRVSRTVRTVCRSRLSCAAWIAARFASIFLRSGRPENISTRTSRRSC